MDKDLFGACPFVTVQKLIQGKWAILILKNLECKPVRFNELQRMMPKMTHSTLSLQLKQLESQGLIIRKQYEGMPPKVEYSLTNIGHSFKPVLDEIEKWGSLYIRDILNKRGIS